jgi:hypothetical protein
MAQKHITTADIGRTVRMPFETFDIGSGARTPGVARYLIEAVEPADDFYYHTCPDAGPRVKATVRRYRSDGATLSATTSPVWLPTIGNDETVEVKA